MKTIGVLGGMGPQATVDFLGKLIRRAGDKCPRILMDLDPYIPSRTLAAMGKGPDPGPIIQGAVTGLEARGARIIAVPCNSAHAWHPGYGPWLHMPSVVSRALRARFVVSPLIIGGYATIARRLYGPYVAGAQYLDDADNEAIYGLIAEIKRASVYGRDLSAKLSLTIGRYRDRCDAFLLACTELSIVWPVDDGGDALALGGTPVIDSSWEYAKAVIAKSRED
jgi:aspartate racemase